MLSKTDRFRELISNIIDLDNEIGEDKTKEILTHLEKARDVAVEIIKSTKDIDTKSNLKRLFSIHSYDHKAKGLMDELESEYWRIIK